MKVAHLTLVICIGFLLKLTDIKGAHMIVTFIIVIWSFENIKGTMMERFIFKGSFCKCATHFSPPVKKTKNLRSFYREYPSEKKQKVFCARNKEQRKADPLHLGFAEIREEIFYNILPQFINGFRYVNSRVLL